VKGKRHKKGDLNRNRGQVRKKPEFKGLAREKPKSGKQGPEEKPN